MLTTERSSDHSRGDHALDQRERDDAERVESGWTGRGDDELQVKLKRSHSMTCARLFTSSCRARTRA